MFLAGLGVECLLKAIRILQFQAAGKPVAAKNKSGSLALAKELKTHELLIWPMLLESRSSRPKSRSWSV